MDALYQRFCSCCHRLQTGQNVSVVNSEIDEILVDPNCWEMCMSVVCNPAALPPPHRVYHVYIAAKMLHLLTARSWTQLPSDLRIRVKTESLAAYLQCFSPTGSPDVAMQCRMCAAMLCRAGEDSVQRDCAQLIAHAATGPDQMLRVISLVKELAVELSFSGDLAPLLCESTVVAKYKVFMLAFFAYSVGRVVRLHQSTPCSVGQAVPPPNFCSELLCAMALLNASLDCMSTWCNSVVPVRGGGHAVDDGDDDSGCRYLTTIHDIVHADASCEVQSISQAFPGEQSHTGATGSNSLKSLLCEIVLPLVINLSTAYGSGVPTTARNATGFLQTLSSSSVSAGTAVVNILHVLFKNCTSVYFAQQCSTHGNCSEAMTGRGSDRLLPVYSLCEMSTAVISSLVSIWELFLGIPSHSFLALASSWGSSGQRSVDATFLADARARLLGGDHSCNMLWSDKGSVYGNASPLLVALIEMTVFSCEKQSMLFFGTDDIFMHSRRALSSYLFRGAVTSADHRGDLVSAGKLSWIFLIYTLLVLPDTKECVVAMTEMLCYLHESSPPELLMQPGPRDLSSQAVFTELIHSFPHVLSRILVDHCTYPTNIPADNIAAAMVRRSGISVVHDRALDLDEEVDHVFRNIRSLRCESSVLVRYLCLYCRGGRDALMEICKKVTTDIVLLADLLSESQLSGGTALVTCDTLFRPLECRIFILSCVGDVAMNDFDNLFAVVGPVPGKFSSALTAVVNSGGVGGSNMEAIVWCQHWLSTSLNVSTAIKTFSDRVSTSTSNESLRSVIYLLKQQLLEIWGAVPFFVRTLHVYLGVEERNFVVGCVLSTFDMMLSDVGLANLASCGEISDKSVFAVLEIVSLADFSLVALDSIVMGLYTCGDDFDEDTGSAGPSSLDGSALVDCDHIGLILQSCLCIHTMANAMQFISGCQSAIELFYKDLFPVLLKVVGRYYGLVGRMLSALCVRAQLSRNDDIISKCGAFLRHQMEELFNGLQAQSHSMFRHVSQNLLHFSDIPSFRSIEFCATLQKQGLPFMLPLLSKLSAIGSASGHEADLVSTIAVASVSIFGTRCIIAGLVGLQLGLCRNKVLSQSWTAQVSEKGGYELLLGLLEEFYHMQLVGKNCVSVGRYVLNMSPHNYGRLAAQLETNFPMCPLLPREMSSNVKKQSRYFNKLEFLFVEECNLVADDLCGMLSELENMRLFRAEDGASHGEFKDSVYLELMNVVENISGNNEQVNSFALCALREVSLPEDREFCFLDSVVLTPSLLRTVSAFLKSTIDSVNAIIAKPVKISEVEIVQRNTAQVSQALLNLIVRIGFAATKLSLSLELHACGDDDLVANLRDILLTIFRTYRQLFLQAPLDLLMRESRLATTFIKYDKSGGSLGPSFASSVWCLDGAASIVGSYFMMMASCIDVENEANKEGIGFGSHVTTKLFQLLLASMKEIEGRLQETCACLHHREKFVALFNKYACEIATKLLKRQILLSDHLKLARKTCAEIFDVIIVMARILYSDSAGPVVVEFISAACLALVPEFHVGYQILFNCKYSPIKHQCVSPDTGCEIRFRANDMCMLIRNTLVSYVMSQKSLVEATSVRRGAGGSRARRRDHGLSILFTGLKNFAKNGGAAAKNDSFAWDFSG